MNDVHQLLFSCGLHTWIAVARKASKIASVDADTKFLSPKGSAMFRVAILLLLVIGSFCTFAGCNSEQAASSVNDDQNQTEPNDSTDETPDKEEKSPAKLSKLVQQYAPIVEVLSLSDEEAAAFEAIHKRYGEDLAKWHESDGKEMRSLQKQALQAARNRDLAALNRLKAAGAKEKVAKFTAAERAIQKEYSTALIGAIPDDRLDRWKAYRVAVTLLDFLEPLNLTEAQKSSVHELAPTAIRSVSKESNWQGYGTSKLEKLFEKQILDADQQDEFETLKSKNKMRMLKWNN